MFKGIEVAIVVKEWEPTLDTESRDPTIHSLTNREPFGAKLAMEMIDRRANPGRVPKSGRYFPGRAIFAPSSAVGALCERPFFVELKEIGAVIDRPYRKTDEF